MIEIQDLIILKNLIPVTKLSSAMGISRQSLEARIKNHSGLKTEESKKITETLKNYGLEYNRDLVDLSEKV